MLIFRTKTSSAIRPIFIIDGLINHQSFLKMRLVGEITVNSVRFHDMKTQFFMLKLQYTDEDDTWFQQDSATCHTLRETELLHESFPGHVISRFSDQNWPVRSCN